MSRLKTTFTICLICLIACAASGKEPIVLALNWKAQPELGGFYQALAEGFYGERGLEVTILQGGPMINNRPLLPYGKADFLVGTNLLQGFEVVRQEIPTRIIAAMLQKDPQCLIAHPGQGYEDWQDLKQAPLLMANTGRQSFFLWMESAHGFKRALLRPYNHSLAPFLAHKDWIQQGYATAEPKRVEEEIKKKPEVFLLAEHGWNSYSTVIETRQELINTRPKLVQDFVDASILGWYGYLYGNHSKADALIKQDNPSITDSQITYSIEQMRAWGLVDSGDALDKGVGTMDAARVEDFYSKMVQAGLFNEDEIDPRDAFTTDFVNNEIGLELKKELLQ